MSIPAADRIMPHYADLPEFRYKVLGDEELTRLLIQCSIQYTARGTADYFNLVVGIKGNQPETLFAPLNQYTNCGIFLMATGIHQGYPFIVFAIPESYRMVWDCIK